MELLENVLFSNILNYDPLGSANMVNSYKLNSLEFSCK